MASKMVFGRGKQVCGFVDEETGQPSSMPIAIYPNAHDQFDSISICWSKGMEEAEALANDILAAVAAVRASVQRFAPERPCPVQGCGRSVGDCPHSDGLTLGTVR